MSLRILQYVLKSIQKFTQVDVCLLKFNKGSGSIRILMNFDPHRPTQADSACSNNGRAWLERSSSPRAVAWVFRNFHASMSHVYQCSAVSLHVFFRVCFFSNKAPKSLANQHHRHGMAAAQLGFSFLAMNRYIETWWFVAAQFHHASVSTTSFSDIVKLTPAPQLEIFRFLRQTSRRVIRCSVSLVR